MPEASFGNNSSDLFYHHLLFFIHGRYLTPFSMVAPHPILAPLEKIRVRWDVIVEVVSSLRPCGCQPWKKSGT